MLGHAWSGLKKSAFLFSGGRTRLPLWKCVPGNNALALPKIKTHMLQFVCDYCETVKPPSDAWINGIAAENVGTQAARREVVIDPSWRRERAVLPFAVHFCSIECKDNYLAELFNQPAELLEVEKVTVEPGQRMVRAKKRPVKAATQTRTSMVRTSGTRVGKPKARR